MTVAQPRKNKRKVIIGVLLVLIGLLIASSVTWAFLPTRWAGLWHLEQAGVIPPEQGVNPVPSSDLGVLASCNHPSKVVNNGTHDPHYETTCYIANIRSDLRAALKIHIFKNRQAKIRYYGVNQHPCQIGDTPLIESDLYVMSPAADLRRKNSRVTAIYEKLKGVDNKVVMLKRGSTTETATGCQPHLQALHQEYQRIGPGEPATNNDAAIDARCSKLQTFVDSLETANPTTPSNESIADCLNLTGEIRRDFIDSLVVVDQDEEWSLTFSLIYGTKPSSGWYAANAGPTVEWDSLDTAAGVALVAFHEYLHKTYFEDLSSKDRIKFHQEILRLINKNIAEDDGGILPSVVFPQEHWDKLTVQEKKRLNPYGCADTKHILLDTGLCSQGSGLYSKNSYTTFVDYLGEDTLGNEVSSRISRHYPTPYDFGELKISMNNLDGMFPISNTTKNRRQQMVDKMLQALPRDMEREYGGFLLDNHGLMSFMREAKTSALSAEALEKMPGLIKKFKELASDSSVDRYNRYTELEGFAGDNLLLAQVLELLDTAARISVDGGSYPGGSGGSGDLIDSIEKFFLTDLKTANFDKRFNLKLVEELEGIMLEHVDPTFTPARLSLFDVFASLFSAAANPEKRLSASSYLLAASASCAAPDKCTPPPEECINEDGTWTCSTEDNPSYPEDPTPVDPIPIIEDYCEDYPDNCWTYPTNGDHFCEMYPDDCESSEPPYEDIARYCETYPDYCETDIKYDEDSVWEHYCETYPEECSTGEPDSQDQESGRDRGPLPDLRLSDGDDMSYTLDNILYSVRWELIFVEGYPIVALEVKERLPTWFENHWGEYLSERQVMADYFRRRS